MDKTANKKKIYYHNPMQNDLLELQARLDAFSQNPISFSEMIGAFVSFFTKLREKATSISSPQDEESFESLLDGLQTLLTLIQPHIKAVSLDAKELLTLLDHPRFFDPDDWNLIEVARERVREQVDEIVASLCPILQSETKESHKGSTSHPKIPVDKWLKS